MKLILISIICALCICPLAFAEESSQEDINGQVNELMEKHKRIPGFSLVGEVKSGRSESYSINGVDFVLASDALITGNFRLGKKAKVRGQIKNGRKIASSVTVSEELYPDDPSSEEAAM